MLNLLDNLVQHAEAYTILLIWVVIPLMFLWGVSLSSWSARATRWPTIIAEAALNPKKEEQGEKEGEAKEIGTKDSPIVAATGEIGVTATEPAAAVAESAPTAVDGTSEGASPSPSPSGAPEELEKVANAAN